jgi:hypothetical protein
MLWVAMVGPRARKLFSALPLGGPTYQPVANDSLTACKWIPSGKELVCASVGGYLYLQPLDFSGGEVKSAGPARRFTTRRLLDTPYFGFDVSPDGNRFLHVVNTPPDTTTRLTVVTNFRHVIEKKIAETQGKAKP